MAFIVRKEVVGNIISCTPISSRLVSIRISWRPHNITVIQVYAPTSDHEDEEVRQLDQIIAKTPKKDILVMQGDWDAKVGPDAYQHCQHSPPPQAVWDSNLACPLLAGSQPDKLHFNTPTLQVQLQQSIHKIFPMCRYWQRSRPCA